MNNKIVTIRAKAFEDEIRLVVTELNIHYKDIVFQQQLDKYIIHYFNSYLDVSYKIEKDRITFFVKPPFWLEIKVIEIYLQEHKNEV